MGLDGYYGVEVPNIWLLVKAIQELKAQNEAQAEEISTLRGEVDNLCAGMPGRQWRQADC